MDTPSQTSPATRPAAPRAAALAGLLACQLVLGLGLGRYALIDPDEGRNAAAAREVAAGGSGLVPTYSGLPFLDKPLVGAGALAVVVDRRRGLGARLAGRGLSRLEGGVFEAWVACGP